jgi:very-short-patch-repair endonuclease
MLARGYKSRRQSVPLNRLCAGFKIDLAVRHPKETGRYILAVECDGATYHSALWARERDRLRQDVLENLGWRFLRIWSTDWFYRRDDQIGKLKNALNDALHSKPVKRRPEHVAPPNPPLTAVPREPVSEFKLPPYKELSPIFGDGLPDQAAASWV